MDVYTLHLVKQYVQTHLMDKTMRHIVASISPGVKYDISYTVDDQVWKHMWIDCLNQAVEDLKNREENITNNS